MFRTVSLNSPWVDYYKRVYQLLSRDPEVKVSEELKEVTPGCYNFYIISSNATKLDALRKVLKTTVGFNQVILRMTFLNADEWKALGDDYGPVIPTDQDWKDAFTGNPLFVRMVNTGKGLFSMTYAVFAHEIIDYYSDDLSDLYGNSHLLPAQIAREVCRFPEGGEEIIPCTDTPVPEEE